MPDPSLEPYRPIDAGRKLVARLGLARARLELFLLDHDEADSAKWPAPVLARFTELLTAVDDLEVEYEEARSSGVVNLFDPHALPRKPAPNVVPGPWRRDVDGPPDPDDL